MKHKNLLNGFFLLNGFVFHLFQGHLSVFLTTDYFCWTKLLISLHSWIHELCGLRAGMENSPWGVCTRRRTQAEVISLRASDKFLYSFQHLLWNLSTDTFAKLLPGIHLQTFYSEVNYWPGNVWTVRTLMLLWMLKVGEEIWWDVGNMLGKDRFKTM